MAEITPLETVRLEEGRVYFVVHRLRHHQLVGGDREAYGRISKLWEKFMAGPDSLSGITMPAELYESFRHLESMLREERSNNSPQLEHSRKFKVSSGA